MPHLFRSACSHAAYDTLTVGLIAAGCGISAIGQYELSQIGSSFAVVIPGDRANWPRSFFTMYIGEVGKVGNSEDGYSSFENTVEFGSGARVERCPPLEHFLSPKAFRAPRTVFGFAPLEKVPGMPFCPGRFSQIVSYCPVLSS